MSEFEDFVETAWADHGDRPQEVAERLLASTGLVREAAQVGPFARLVVHVLGEHLGHWDQGLRLLDALRGTAGGDPAAEALLDRQAAALRQARGDAGVLDALSAEDRPFVLAMCASMHTGRGDFARAIAAYRAALDAAAGGLPAGAPALRALAVAGNNLAAALEDKPDRNADEAAGMVLAAEGGLAYWQRAGTWLEHERAEYRLSSSLRQAGRAAEAADAARRCLAVCDAHGADAFERFFGHAALAAALRKAGDDAGFEAARREALAAHAQVPESERIWCESDLKAIADAT